MNGIQVFAFSFFLFCSPKKKKRKVILQPLKRFPDKSSEVKWHTCRWRFPTAFRFLGNTTVHTLQTATCSHDISTGAAVFFS